MTLVDGEEVTDADLVQMKAACLAALPDRKFSIIYADCPWLYARSTGIRGVPTYPQERLKDLALLPVKRLAACDCLLFMWATAPLMKQAIELGEAWGFTYITICYVWNKTTKNGATVCGLGRYTRSSCEFILLFKSPKTRTKNLVRSFSQRQLHNFVRTKHSEKPKEFRTLLTELCHTPDGCIELFAREQEKVDGWCCWGLECANYCL